MLLKQSKRRLLLITFIISVLVLPVVPVGAKKSGFSNITVERINSKITRFEETIPLNIPDPRIPDGASYKVSVYGVKVRGGVVLIDCGDDTLAEELYRTISCIYRRKRIKAVYLTHYHADHAGAGLYFQQKGIPVYAPEAEAMFIQMGANLQTGIPDEFTYEGYTPDGYYEYIDLEKGFETIPAPGHTFGAVHIEYNKGRGSYLFTADTILSMETFDPVDPEYTYELTLQTAIQNYDLEVNGVGPFWTMQLQTLNEMLETVDDYDLVLTGHTPVLDDDEASTYISSTIETLGYFPYL